MPTYVESNANGRRKRVPLTEAMEEAFPEHTPALSLIDKATGKKTTSPEANSSKVEWGFLGFEPGEIRGTGDNEDFDPDSEAEDNESYKGQVENRIMLMRAGVKTGRIANSVTVQHGVPGEIHLDHKMACLRRFRHSTERWLVSECDGRPETGTPKAPYTSRAFASWHRTHASGGHVDLPIPALARPAAGQHVNIDAAADVTIGTLTGMLQAQWETRLTPGNWHLFGSAAFQTAVDGMLEFGPTSSNRMPLRRVNQDSEDREICMKVKSLDNTFGHIDFSLHAALPKPVTLTGCVTTNGSKTVTVSTNKKLYPGMPVIGTGIAAGTRIAAVPSKKTSMVLIYLDTNATADGTVSLSFGEEIFAEMWDFEHKELGYIDEVGWEELENKGGGKSGYTDALQFFAYKNPQAGGIIRKTQSGFNGAA
jgi:hypothetical protein